MLAGESFTDRPTCVCPVVAAFLRGYNDNVDDGLRPRLYGLAADVLDSRVGWRDEVGRAERCMAFARRLHATRRLRCPWGPAFRFESVRHNAEIAGAHCAIAARRRPELHAEVEAFVRSLVAEPEPVVVPEVVPTAARRRARVPAAVA
ncbi:hypothetical protein [Conexibacter sp. SYSU D00693]|uniref:hypothetical protein n=1 Tax=Conexibacter sp. SYSU D00693 TaxID=2812560 RepID=UPI00196B1162|nr:hypothetical protein [Conexibacter sp. SYSU D00693]